MRASRVALLVVVTALPSAPAQASFVRIDTCVSKGCSSAADAVYQAAAWERNDLTVTLEGGRYVFRDPGAVITTEDARDCVVVTDHEASCAPLGGTTAIFADLDNEDDRVDASALRDHVVFYGGTGADVLLAGSGGSTLVGEEGADRLVGGLGADQFDAGGADAADSIDGGDGVDLVSYASRREGVTVNLGEGRAGRPFGEVDRLASIENVSGSRWDDVIVGDAAANDIQGLEGADRLLGTGGDDRVSGGPGRDRMRGGAGNDTLLDSIYEAPSADVLFGDAGADVLKAGGGTDRLYGGTGDDDLKGGPDNDFLHGGPGADGMRGEWGIDFFMARDGNRDRVSGGAARDRCRCDPFDRLVSLEVTL